MRVGRQRAVAEVDRAYAAGELRWGEVASLVHAFPRRGMLDEYIEGHEDEDDAPAGKSWCDHEEHSSASEGPEVALCCAGGDKATARKATTVGEGEVAEELRQISDIRNTR